MDSCLQSSDDVSVDRLGDVLLVNIDRISKKNSLTQAMYHHLAACINVIERQEITEKVMLLTANGDTFCAGNDLGEFLAASGGTRDRSGAEAFVEAITTTTIPIVAAVNGHAIGIGATLLLHADYILMSASAELRFPFVDLGLVPEAGATLLIPQLMGYQRAARLLFLDGTLSAKEAVDVGMVSEITSAEQLSSRALEVAQRIADKPANSLRKTKLLMKSAMQEVLQQQIDAEVIALEKGLQQKESQSSIRKLGSQR